MIASVVTVVAMTMVLVGTFESSVPFIGPADLSPDLEGHRIQVEGIVQTMTVETDHLLLELTDGTGATAVVRYTFLGQRPLTIDEERLVVAKGIYRGGVVEADQVSVRAHENEGSP